MRRIIAAIYPAYHSQYRLRQSWAVLATALACVALSLNCAEAKQEEHYLVMRPLRMAGLPGGSQYNTAALSRGGTGDTFAAVRLRADGLPDPKAGPLVLKRVHNTTEALQSAIRELAYGPSMNKVPHLCPVSRWFIRYPNAGAASAAEGGGDAGFTSEDGNDPADPPGSVSAAIFQRWPMMGRGEALPGPVSSVPLGLYSMSDVALLGFSHPQGSSASALAASVTAFSAPGYPLALTGSHYPHEHLARPAPLLLEQPPSATAQDTLEADVAAAMTARAIGISSAMRDARDIDSSAELWLVYPDCGVALSAQLFTAQPEPLGAGVAGTAPTQSEPWHSAHRRVPLSRLLAPPGQASEQQQKQPLASSAGVVHASALWLRLVRSSQTNSAIAAVVRQLNRAVRSLHARGLVHRDIKASNVLLAQSAEHVVEVAAIDLGAAVPLHAYAQSVLYPRGVDASQGTEAYLPPEAALAGECGPLSAHAPWAYDTWTTGLLALEWALGKPIASWSPLPDRAVSMAAALLAQHGYEQNKEQAVRAFRWAGLCVIPADPAQWGWGSSACVSDALLDAWRDWVAWLRRKQLWCDAEEQFVHAVSDQLLQPDILSPAALEWLWQALAWDPEQRPTATQQLRMLWLR